MTLDRNLPDLLQREAVAPKRFDPRSATPFVNKLVSEENPPSLSPGSRRLLPVHWGQASNRSCS